MNESMISAKNEYMKEAIKEAYQGIEQKHGGPFGAVIVKDGKIVGHGHNSVLIKNDPTCHGEIEASALCVFMRVFGQR